jgi:hypothetical protein
MDGVNVLSPQPLLAPNKKSIKLNNMPHGCGVHGIISGPFMEDMYGQPQKAGGYESFPNRVQRAKMQPTSWI